MLVADFFFLTHVSGRFVCKKIEKTHYYFLFYHHNLTYTSHTYLLDQKMQNNNNYNLYYNFNLNNKQEMSQLFLYLTLISLPLSTSHNITPLLHIMSYPSLCFFFTETFNLLLWLKEQKMKRSFLEKSSSIQISIFPQSFQI